MRTISKEISDRASWSRLAILNLSLVNLFKLNYSDKNLLFTFAA